MSQMKRITAELSPLEARVMEVLWSRERVTADEVRRALAPGDRLTDSSVRTLLRRLEAKNYATHVREGKAFLYRATIRRPGAMAAAARRIIQTIGGGTARSLMIGLIEEKMISAKELDEIRARIERGEVDDE